MIRRASALAPDDASITDSLGWALYKRAPEKRRSRSLPGRRAAIPARDPRASRRRALQGRQRFEARYAWEAALVTADERSPREEGQAPGRSDPGDRRARDALCQGRAPAKLNLALRVREKLPDGRHRIETVFAFCTDGDRLEGEAHEDLALDVAGPMAATSACSKIVTRAAYALMVRRGAGFLEGEGASLTLTKNLPVASRPRAAPADAAAALRLLTAMWRLDPARAPSRPSLAPTCPPACSASALAGTASATSSSSSTLGCRTPCCWSTRAFSCRRPTCSPAGRHRPRPARRLAARPRQRPRGLRRPSRCR